MTAKKKPKVAVPPAAEQRARIEYMELGELLKFPRNPKGHDFIALGEAFGERGFVTPLLMDERSGYLVEGHGSGNEGSYGGYAIYLLADGQLARAVLREGKRG